MLIPSLGAPLPVPQLMKLGIHTLLGDLKVEDFDALHHMIYTYELHRAGSHVVFAITGGFGFALPILLKNASSELQDRFAGEFLMGKKRICLAVTEPGAGSDVANIATKADRVDVDPEEESCYILSGTKKFITNALFSDYAVMLVRTGRPDSGLAGLSLMLVPLANTPGVTITPLNISGREAAGIAYIHLSNVRVPLSNLIGADGDGMRLLMRGFNHERLSLAISTNRLARTGLALGMKYALRRQAFGKALIEQPLVRHRLAKCGIAVETHYAWVEGLCYRLSQSPSRRSKASSREKEETLELEIGGMIALVKAQGGLVLQECANTAALVFGGCGVVSGGEGEAVERLGREALLARIPGTDDVMLDVGVRQLIKGSRKRSEELAKL
jgi:acyl-CoA dehydrogenase